MRSCLIVFMFACAMCLSACEQDPDFVLRVQALDSGQAGAGAGFGNTGGGPPIAEPPACDPTIAAVYAQLARVAGEQCRFAIADRTLGQLLLQYIFSQDVPDETGENSGFTTCAFATAERPEIGFAYSASLEDAAAGTLTLCPAYCRLLDTWVDDHDAQSRACLPDSGM